MPTQDTRACRHSRRLLRPAVAALMLLASPAISAVSVAAAELAASSKITSVVVYPSGAEIAREASVSLPAGQTTLVFRDLPSDIRPETIRIEGLGTSDIVIGSVEVSRQTLTEDERGVIASEGRALREQREVEEKALAEVSALLEVKSTQKKFLENLATLPTNQGLGGGRDSGVAGLDWAEMFDLIGSNMAAVQREILALRDRQTKTEKRIADIDKQLQRVAGQPRQAMVGKVEINNDAASETKFTLRYAVRNASWTPLYDARLTTSTATDKPSLQLVRRAAIRQSTSEPWRDVALTLSTVRPAGRTAAPAVRPVTVDFAPPPRPAATVAAAPPVAQLEALQDRATSTRGNRFAGRARMARAARKSRPATAKVRVGSFQASYAIDGATTIANNGAVRNLMIDTQDIEPKLKVLTAPRIDKRAYLYANFKLPDGTPFLRGVVSLFRDNTYVGRGQLPELAGGAEHELGFGADNLVTVKFATRDEKRGETGIISSSKTDRRGFRFEITNQHDRPIAYTILDRLPKSRNDDILVERFGGSKPTRTDVDDKQGVVAWDGKLNAKATRAIDFGYLITWPADKRVIYR